MASEMRNNMAHEVETMAWANDVPWHGLGRKVDSDLTPDQILLHDDLDWKVQMKPVQWLIKIMLSCLVINIFH